MSERLLPWAKSHVGNWIFKVTGKTRDVHPDLTPSASEVVTVQAGGSTRTKKQSRRRLSSAPASAPNDSEAPPPKNAPYPWTTIVDGNGGDQKVYSGLGEKERQLFDAIESSDEQAVRELIAQSVDVNATRQDHFDRPESCLLFAFYRCRLDSIITLLLESGATTTIGLERITLQGLSNKSLPKSGLLLLKLCSDIDKGEALYAACEGNNAEALKELIKANVDLNVQNAKERTPVQVAVENGSHEVVGVLLSHSAKLDLTGRNGLTAFDIAVQKGDTKMVHVFLDHFQTEINVPTADVLALDSLLAQNKAVEALEMLQKGAIVAQRALKEGELKNSGHGSIVGPRSSYLESLCTTLAKQVDSSCADTALPAIKDTAVDKSIPIASRWLLTCLTSHSNCIKAEGPLPNLPTRVIDVGPPDGSKQPRLVLGHNLRGRYVALSHRWGNMPLAKTTEANLQRQLQGIGLGGLTKVMQDAIAVTQQLGARYLWIDALCIIQDSHSDWSVESYNMADIYRNALVTIAAGVAPDASNGLFSENYNKSGWSYSAREILGTRGWIFQEQLLSPRIIQYAKGHLDWECVSLTASATDERGAWTEPNFPDVYRFKRALAGLRSTSTSLEQQARLSWRDIVHHFSERKLTFPADKLMALMGITRFLGNITHDRFLLGLWEPQLSHDLLWTSMRCGVLPRLGVRMPTWSWASVDGPVHYTWPAGSSPAFVQPLLSLESATVDSNPSRGDVEGRLIVNGPLMVVYARDDPNSSDRLFYTRNVQSPKRTVPADEDDQYSKDHYKEWSAGFFKDTSEDIPSKLWLLPVASEHYWIYCLALAPASRSGEYRRVGLCHIDSFKPHPNASSKSKRVILV